MLAFNAVNVSRLLLDIDSGSESELAVNVTSLLCVLCSSEPVKIIGILNIFITYVPVSVEH